MNQEDNNLYNFSQSGDIVQLVSKHMPPIKETLNPGIYRIEETPKGEIYLNFVIGRYNPPSNIYGGIKSYVKMMVDNYKERPCGSGAILIGNKGSGKTCTAELFCNEMIDSGIPIIQVDRACKTEILIKTIPKLGPCIVVMDEFGKNFTSQHGSPQINQDSLLSLFSCSTLKKVMFIVLENEHNQLSNYIKSRPERFQFMFEFMSFGIETFDEVYSSMTAEPLPEKHRVFINSVLTTWQLSGIDYGLDTVKTLVLLAIKHQDNLSNFIEEIQHHNTPALQQVKFRIYLKKTNDRKEPEDSFFVRREEGQTIVQFEGSDEFTVTDSYILELISDFLEKNGEGSFGVNKTSDFTTKFKSDRYPDARVVVSFPNIPKPWEGGRFNSTNAKTFIKNFNSVIFFESTVKQKSVSQYSGWQPKGSALSEVDY